MKLLTGPRIEIPDGPCIIDGTMTTAAPEILVIAAMKDEAAEFITGVAPRYETSGGDRSLKHYYEPGPYESRVGFLCCGVGRTAARTTLSGALKFLKPREILIMGYSGALHPDRHPGDLIVVEHVFDWHAPIHRRLSFDPGCRGALERYLDEACVPWHRGSAVCVDRMIDTRRDKENLRDRFPADCVDMESIALLDVIRESGIPGAMIRVISDYADESLGLDFSKIPSSAHRRRLYFLTHPRERRAFQELITRARNARKIMHAAVAGYLRACLRR
ncbi:MAG TPA: hypothetical protein PLV45_01395 [bacterium]|nr:hypothetical protein [bacterium]